MGSFTGGIGHGEQSTEATVPLFLPARNRIHLTRDSLGLPSTQDICRELVNCSGTATRKRTSSRLVVRFQVQCAILSWVRRGSNENMSVWGRSAELQRVQPAVRLRE